MLDKVHGGSCAVELLVRHALMRGVVGRLIYTQTCEFDHISPSKLLLASG